MQWIISLFCFVKPLITAFRATLRSNAVAFFLGESKENLPLPPSHLHSRTTFTHVTTVLLCQGDTLPHVDVTTKGSNWVHRAKPHRYHLKRIKSNGDLAIWRVCEVKGLHKLLRSPRFVGNAANESVDGDFLCWFSLFQIRLVTWTLGHQKLLLDPVCQNTA